MKPPTKQLRAFMAAGDDWPTMRRAVRRLKDSELAEAERLERLGKRRVNNLLTLRAERKRRLKSHHMMMRLKAEVRL
jgi:hypothetical protein